MSSNQNSEWWLEKDKETQASIIKQTTDALLQQQLWRRNDYDTWSLMYNKTTAYGWAGSTLFGRSNDRLALNVVKNCCDSFVSLMTEEKPKAKYVTNGTDWDMQEKAKDLEKFVDGQMYGMGLYELAPRVVLDSCCYGTGFLHVYIDGSKEDAKVACEKTHPGELFVDDLDGKDGAPRELRRRKLVDKRKLIAMFPKSEYQIAQVKCDRQDPMWPTTYETTAELIPVYEDWHLRSSKKSKDGAYCCAIDGHALHSDTWDYDYFPFVPYRRSRALNGYWGISLTDELRGIQREINELASKIQKHHYLLGHGHWFVEGNSKVVSSHLANEINIIRYFGSKPHVEFPQTMSADIYQHLWALYAKSYEITGISQMQAAGRIPSELSGSGKAMATFAHLTSKRFAWAVDDYHTFFREVAEQVIDRAREIVADDNPKYSVNSVSRQGFTEVEFLSVDMEKAEAILQVQVTNKLAKEFPERMAQVKDLVTSFPDRFDSGDAIRALDVGDVEALTNEKTANENRCRQIVNKILKGEKVIQPRPMANLSKWIEIATAMMFDAEIKNANDADIQRLRDWIVLCEEMEQRWKAKQGGGGNGAPPDGGMAPPAMGAPPGMGGPPPMAPPGAPPMPPPPPMDQAAE